MGRRVFGGELIEKIRYLRTKGWSVPELAREAGMSKTTALRYVKDVLISEEYVKQWFGKRGGSRRRKYKSLLLARDMATSLITILTKEQRILILASLYWAEGNKQSFIFMNSDPNMISLFVFLIVQDLGVSIYDIRVNVRVYDNMNEVKVINYWSRLLGIPLENFKKTEVVKGTKGKLEWGMCRIRVIKGGFLLKYLSAVKNQMVILSSPRSSMDRAEVS